MRFDRLLTTIDAHAEGNPERVVLSGIPYIPGSTMLEKSKYVRSNLDYLRTFLVHEPRGHSNMYAALVVPPCDRRADFGVIYMEPGGYVTMCGHGTIAVCTVLIETGVIQPVEPETEIVLDTPAGLIQARVEVKGGKAVSVTIQNVPSFLYMKDVIVEVDEIGKVKTDIAYGGNFYAILEAQSVGLEIRSDQVHKIIAFGTKIWRAVNEEIEIHHPEKPEIDCVNYVEFSAPATNPKANMKNAVVVPPGGIDRSPCGTGTSAKMAILHAKGELALGEEFVHESIIGSLFYGKLTRETQVGGYQAVVPTIRGSAYITGIHQFVVDPEDPFPKGFQLGKAEKLYGFEFRTG
ncbi:MAG: proline racemase family protein [Deltaproteobacteria bacterium]|nr:proline racemase family protein [Deltaproteobacteria bacterium]MBW1929831.1 proline racemase family protein [Deltaproteobacteria bacterium]MBW2024124.1 proline racemase family protein [Deltaproteobacteria bacterium]MBW2124383.1 proline racemase family protein [Deltaproteobacteria bacterium]